VDRAVGSEVLRLLQPLGIEAALKAIEARDAETGEKRRQIELALEQARYEATRARRQYDAVDPDNRLVAAEFERRWNERLPAVRQIEELCLLKIPSADFGAGCSDFLVRVARTRTGYCPQGR
jgi:hypothetical protein